MQLKLHAAPATLLAVLLFSACSSDQAANQTAVPDTPVLAAQTPAPPPLIVETIAPPMDTVPPVTPPPTPIPVASAQTEQVPSVMRRASATPPPVQQVTSTFPPRVSVPQLREMIDEGTAVIVDSRDRVSFAIEHIPGSINIPAQESTARVSELPKGKTIVTYCA